MTIIHSSDLGWTEGQDISKEFAALAKTFKPGDTFVFDHMYDISGNGIQLPDNFTLAGGAPGAGINVIDTASNSNPLIELGNANTLVDLTVTHSNAPQTRTDSTNPKSGVDYHNKVTIVAENKDDVKVLNSYFEGNVGIQLDIRGGDNLLVENTEFNGGFYQLRLGGDLSGPTIQNSLFQNSLGDGIKTVPGGNGTGVSEATVIGSVFLNNGRDGIDTTGGFADSLVTGTYFVGNGVSGMDIKSIYDSSDDLMGNRNDGILITDSEFINNTNAVVVTTEDRGSYLNTSNAQQYAAQNIAIENSVIENTSSNYSSRMLLVKDGYNVHWSDVSLLGLVHESREISNLNIGLPQNVSGTGVTEGETRGQAGDAYYQNLAGPDWSNISYPVDGTPTPPETTQPGPGEVESGVDEPVVEEPIKSDPVEDDPAPVEASNYLDIFLAYTDTDQTVSQLGDGSSVDGSLTDGRPLTIVATSQDGAPQIGSVKLTVDGVGSRVENVEPYALFGDDGKGDFFGGQKLTEGTYSAELVVFDGQKGSGSVLETVTFEFTVGDTGSAPVVEDPIVEDPVVEDPIAEDPVVEDPVEVVAPEENLAPDATPQEPYSQLLDLQLIDTSTDTFLTDLYQGAKLSSSDLSGKTVTLSAEALNPNVNIGSVRLELDGQYSRVENVEPYALFGDNGKGNFFGGKQLSDGAHSITLTVYSDKNGKGSVLEKVTVEFEVGDYDSVLIDGSAHIVSSYSEAQDEGVATVSIDQSAIELEGSAWKSLAINEDITEATVLEFDFKSDAEGEIQGIGFVNEDGELETTFFQLDGSQTLGIQDFNDGYETGSGYTSYSIPVGQYFTGSVQQLVLVNDDDANLAAMSTFDNISLIDAIV